MSYCEFLAEEIEAEQNWIASQAPAQTTTAQPAMSQGSTDWDGVSDPFEDDEPVTAFFREGVRK